MFQFQHKDFLWLYLLIGVLLLFFLAYLGWKRKVFKRIGDKKLARALISGYAPGRSVIKFSLILLALAFGVTAALNPRRPGGPGNDQRQGIDVVFALDVSKSMLATDLQPNRLERAKQFIWKMMDAMPNDRVALVLFAGKAYLQLPLTSDHGAAKLYVSSASPNAVQQQGTVISEALERGTDAFFGTDNRYKTIILISDGEEHDQAAVETATELASQGVMINCVGVGSPEGSMIIDPATGSPKTDETGATVITKLNEETLRQMAATTNGIYIPLQSSDEAVGQLESQLAQIEKKAFPDEATMNFKTYYMWFAAGMLLLLLVEQLVPETKKQNV